MIHPHFAAGRPVTAAMADGFMTHPVTDKAEVFDRWANKRYEATRQVVAA